MKPTGVISLTFVILLPVILCEELVSKKDERFTTTNSETEEEPSSNNKIDDLGKVNQNANGSQSSLSLSQSSTNDRESSTHKSPNKLQSNTKFNRFPTSSSVQDYDISKKEDISTNNENKDTELNNSISGNKQPSKIENTVHNSLQNNDSISPQKVLKKNDDTNLGKVSTKARTDYPPKRNDVSVGKENPTLSATKNNDSDPPWKESARTNEDINSRKLPTSAEYEQTLKVKDSVKPTSGNASELKHDQMESKNTLEVNSDLTNNDGLTSSKKGNLSVIDHNDSSTISQLNNNDNKISRERLEDTNKDANSQTLPTNNENERPKHKDPKKADDKMESKNSLDVKKHASNSNSPTDLQKGDNHSDSLPPTQSLNNDSKVPHKTDGTNLGKVSTEVENKYPSKVSDSNVKKENSTLSTQMPKDNDNKIPQKGSDTTGTKEANSRKLPTNSEKSARPTNATLRSSESKSENIDPKETNDKMEPKQSSEFKNHPSNNNSRIKLQKESPSIDNGSNSLASTQPLNNNNDSKVPQKTPNKTEDASLGNLSSKFRNKYPSKVNDTNMEKKNSTLSAQLPENDNIRQPEKELDKTNQDNDLRKLAANSKNESPLRNEDSAKPINGTSTPSENKLEDKLIDPKETNNKMESKNSSEFKHHPTNNNSPINLEKESPSFDNQSDFLSSIELLNNNDSKVPQKTANKTEGANLGNMALEVENEYPSKVDDHNMGKENSTLSAQIPENNDSKISQKGADGTTSTKDTNSKTFHTNSGDERPLKTESNAKPSNAILSSSDKKLEDIDQKEINGKMESENSSGIHNQPPKDNLEKKSPLIDHQNDFPLTPLLNNNDNTRKIPQKRSKETNVQVDVDSKNLHKNAKNKDPIKTEDIKPSKNPLQENRNNLSNNNNTPISLEKESPFIDKHGDFSSSIRSLNTPNSKAPQDRSKKINEDKNDDSKGNILPANNTTMQNETLKTANNYTLTNITNNTSSTSSQPLTNETLKESNGNGNFDKEPPTNIISKEIEHPSKIKNESMKNQPLDNNDNKSLQKAEDNSKNSSTNFENKIPSEFDEEESSVLPTKNNDAENEAGNKTDENSKSENSLEMNNEHPNNDVINNTTNSTESPKNISNVKSSPEDPKETNKSEHLPVENENDPDSYNNRSILLQNDDKLLQVPSNKNGNEALEETNGNGNFDKKLPTNIESKETEYPSKIKNNTRSQKLCTKCKKNISKKNDVPTTVISFLDENNSKAQPGAWNTDIICNDASSEEESKYPSAESLDKENTSNDDEAFPSLTQTRSMGINNDELEPEIPDTDDTGSEPNFSNFVNNASPEFSPSLLHTPKKSNRGILSSENPTYTGNDPDHKEVSPQIATPNSDVTILPSQSFDTGNYGLGQLSLNASDTNSSTPELQQKLPSENITPKNPSLDTGKEHLPEDNTATSSTISKIKNESQQNSPKNASTPPIQLPNKNTVIDDLKGSKKGDKGIENSFPQTIGSGNLNTSNDQPVNYQNSDQEMPEDANYDDNKPIMLSENDENQYPTGMKRESLEKGNQPTDSLPPLFQSLLGGEKSKNRDENSKKENVYLSMVEKAPILLANLLPGTKNSISQPEKINDSARIFEPDFEDMEEHPVNIHDKSPNIKISAPKNNYIDEPNQEELTNEPDSVSPHGSTLTNKPAPTLPHEGESANQPILKTPYPAASPNHPIPASPFQGAPTRQPIPIFPYPGAPTNHPPVFRTMFVSYLSPPQRKSPTDQRPKQIRSSATFSMIGDNPFWSMMQQVVGMGVKGAGALIEGAGKIAEASFDATKDVFDMVKSAPVVESIISPVKNFVENGLDVTDQTVSGSLKNIGSSINYQGESTRQRSLGHDRYRYRYPINEMVTNSIDDSDESDDFKAQNQPRPTWGIGSHGWQNDKGQSLGESVYPHPRYNPRFWK